MLSPVVVAALIDETVRVSLSKSRKSFSICSLVSVFELFFSIPVSGELALMARGVSFDFCGKTGFFP